MQNNTKYNVKYHHRLEDILENSGAHIEKKSKIIEYEIKQNIDNKIFIISQILDLLERKLYKYFPNKRLNITKKKLNDQLFNLYIYGCEK
jgi:hypothetical protein